MPRPIASLLVLTLITICGPALAQPGKKPIGPKTPDVAAIKTLDTEAEQLEADFLQSLTKLATSYEEAGDKDKAKAMLQAILKMRPDADLVKDKIKQLDESVFTDRQQLFDYDTSRGWISTGILVEKGAEVRVESTGNYKLIVNDELGPEGYHSESGKGEDFFDGAPTGALIGVIVPASAVTGGRPQRGKDGPQPFLVGTQKQFKPQESGLLVVRVNSPANAKCVGRLKLRISGNIGLAGK